MNKWIDLILKIHVHPFLWIIAALGLVTGHMKALLCLLLIVLVHELGHAALAVVFFLENQTCLFAAVWRNGGSGRARESAAKGRVCGHYCRPSSAYLASACCLDACRILSDSSAYL